MPKLTDPIPWAFWAPGALPVGAVPTTVVMVYQPGPDLERWDLYRDQAAVVDAAAYAAAWADQPTIPIAELG